MKKKLSKTHHCTQCTLSTTIQKMTKKGQKKTRPHCLKIIQNVAFDFYFGIFHKFCLIKTDLSGNTVFKNSPKSTNFWHFKVTLSKLSSLCSQWWMRLFLWFSNTVARPARQRQLGCSWLVNSMKSSRKL